MYSSLLILWKSDTGFFERNSLKRFSSICSTFEISELLSCEFTSLPDVTLMMNSQRMIFPAQNYLFYTIWALKTFILVLSMVFYFCLEGVAYFIKIMFSQEGLLILYHMGDCQERLLIL